ncbi:MAG: NADP-specific glutamate dehydrogenase, partial [Clostridia bacterium]|nr:NADP-specific glutamate dehydrogenase [Clostridia bacterium]
SDFDPKGKSDMEIMRFCQSFMSELYRHIGDDVDVPAGDLGVGGREIGFLFGQYKKLTGKYTGTITGKPIVSGGLLGRAEATGYGVVTFLTEVLKHENDTIKDKVCVVSGYGNVTWGTVKKLDMLGAKVITISGKDGYILDEEGITGDKIDYLLEMRDKKTGAKGYVEKYPNAKYFPGEKPWGVKADIYIPCATQNEINLEDAKLIVSSGSKYLIEGANMPTLNEAIAYLQENGVIVAPAKAANAGGVACSCIEMNQNASHDFFNEKDVLDKLDEIMINIHKQSMEAAEKYGLGYDLVKGANIAGFEKVAEAMMCQGIV